ncbi:hypothetical protein R3P38DRAFT_3194606 [Favolaschia claudopus]|uniref:Uncharacterized protein n=1 Tax=Favolaschia claudopus TaxID=2862362 RepID=A0AAW0BDK0_9AGAR
MPPPPPASPRLMSYNGICVPRLLCCSRFDRRRAVADGFHAIFVYATSSPPPVPLPRHHRSQTARSAASPLSQAA